VDEVILKKKIGNKIKKLRDSNGLPQKVVAAKLEMSPTAYGNMERGETDICITRLVQIAEIFHADLSDILDFKEKTIYNYTANSETNNGNNLQIFSSSPELREIILKNEVERCQLEIRYLKEENSYLKQILNWLKIKNNP